MNLSKIILMVTLILSSQAYSKDATHCDNVFNQQKLKLTQAISEKINSSALSKIISTYKENSIDISEENIQILNPAISQNWWNSYKNTYIFNYLYKVTSVRPVNLATNDIQLQFFHLEFLESVHRDFLTNSVLNYKFTCQTRVEIKSNLRDPLEDSTNKKFRLLNLDSKTDFIKYGHGIRLDSIFSDDFEWSQSEVITVKH